MANSAQAKKRARQAEIHRQLNSSHRSMIRTSIKKVNTAIAGGDYETARAAFKSAEPVIDSITRKGIIHKNKAARDKSHLSAKIKALQDSNVS